MNGESPKLVRVLLAEKFSPVLKSAGFKKERLTWRKKSSDLVRVIQIQGSQWSSNLFVNLGIFVRELGNSEKPSEAHCHARTRLPDLVPIEFFDLAVDDKELETFGAGRKLASYEAKSIEPFLERQTELLRKFGLPKLERAQPKAPIWWITKDAENYFLENAA